MQDMVNKRFDKQTGRFIIEKQKNLPILAEIKTYE